MDCHEIAFGDFIQSLAGGNGHPRIPLQGGVEVTPYCNLKCVHCYIAGCDWDGGLLTTADFFRIFDEIAEMGCFFLLLTGGEPFLRKDFLDIYTYAKKKGMLVSIFTNGTLITPEIAGYLHHLPPYRVEITLYGATKATYEKVTGVPGSFERCHRGIDLLREQGVELTLKTMVLTLNRHEVWEMKRFAQGLGLRFKMDSLIIPSLDGGHEVCQSRISPEEVVALDQEDPDRRAEWKAARDFLPRMKPPPPETLFPCGAGMASFHIDAFGQLGACTLVRQPGYDLKRGSFKEGWQDFIPSVLAQRPSQPPRCRRCRWRMACVACPGWGQLETGKLEEGPVPYLCEIAHRRAEAFGLEWDMEGKALA